MKLRTFNWLLLISSLAVLQTGMARQGQYDEEARQAEREAKKSGSRFTNPAKGMAQGVKEATVDSTAGFLSETAETTRDEPPIVGTLEGTRKGSQKILDNTVKGALKVATFGQSDGNYEVIEPESNSGEPTKIRIKIPGT